MTVRPFSPADPRVTAEPRSVARDGERAERALRALRETFEAAPNQEVAAWTKLESRLRLRRPSLWPYVSALVGAGAIAVVTAAFVGKDGARSELQPQPQVQPPRAEASRAAADTPRPIEGQAATAAALSVGPTVLPGGARAHLRGGARAAWIATSAAGGHVLLEDGTLALDADAPVDVRVAALRVAGSAGRYQITAHGDGVDVVVERGEAVVWSSVRVLKRVVAGERWSSTEPGDEPTPAPAPRAPIRGAPAQTHRTERPAAVAPVAPAPAGESRDCLRLARDGVTDAAISCFEGQSAQSGLTGELALLELARIRRDVKGDLTGAERLLAEHGRRFPHSALAAEARTLHVELLLRLGHAGEALAEAERLAGAEAIFWRAACLARLGRRDEARRTFDDYLGRDGIERRNEAARKRAELDEPIHPVPQ
jgi:hypothetical protein